MNEKFLELPEEKRNKIINAGFEVFGLNDYKHASTEDIAAKAGISKGLLFYYFQNKRTLYTFLFEKASDRIKEYVVDAQARRITDFFEFCAYTAERKCRMLSRSPHIMEFILRAYYFRDEAVSGEIHKKMREETAAIYGTYFGNIDFSKFRSDVDPMEIYHMLTWMVDGYLHEGQMSGQSIVLDGVMEKFRLWSDYFRRISYKEESMQ